jgi:hypothetical protein
MGLAKGFIVALRPNSDDQLFAVDATGHIPLD